MLLPGYDSSRITGTMYCKRYVWAGLVLLVVLSSVSPGCRSQRLREVSQKPDERTEEQIRAKRHLIEAQALFDQGKAGEAQKEFLTAIDNDPMQYKAHLGLGDIYELEGDGHAAVVEYIAHTELSPRARHYLDRMFTYVFSKFARTPSDPDEVPDRRVGEAFELVSYAVAQHRRGKHDVALRLLDKANRILPNTGAMEYVAGVVRLGKGDEPGAMAAFETAVCKNPYFARRLMTDGDHERLPGLLSHLEKVLSRALAKHPSDTETAFLLGALRLRLGRPRDALEAVRNALAWGRPRWDVLLVKAAAHGSLGQTVQMEQAFADLERIQPNVSEMFTDYEPSVFQGLLAGTITDLTEQRFAPVLQEPARSYFLWRLLEERGDTGAQTHRDRFFQVMQQAYSADEFTGLPSTGPPDREPEGTQEFMGMVQERIQAMMPALLTCDTGRRDQRARQSGRVTLRVAIGRKGTVEQVAIQENTTEDRWLAYCMLRKVIEMRFPEPFRASESFRLPVLVGPEVDEPAAGEQSDKSGQTRP